MRKVIEGTDGFLEVLAALEQILLKNQVFDGFNKQKLKVGSFSNRLPLHLIVLNICQRIQILEFHSLLAFERENKKVLKIERGLLRNHKIHHECSPQSSRKHIFQTISFCNYFKSNTIHT